MLNQIVILAGGKGTRMGNADVPKVLVMLKNKPLILYLLEQVEKINQLAKPIIVVGYKYRQVMDVLGEDYLYAIQNQQLGTADALRVALPKVKGENILVLYGDMPFIKAESLKKLIQKHFDTKANITMFTAKASPSIPENATLFRFGRIKRDGLGKIIGSVEATDASFEDLKIDEVNPCIFMFNAKWLRNNIDKINNHNVQGEFYLTDIVGLAATQGEQIETLDINPNEVLGINSREDLVSAEKLLN